MVYSQFANASKNVCHKLIDYTFPRSATIATISVGVSWYAYQFSMTYSQGYLAGEIAEQFRITCQAKADYQILTSACHKIGILTAPLIVPWLSPYISTQGSLAAYTATSLTLNAISVAIFGTGEKPVKKDSDSVNDPNRQQTKLKDIDKNIEAPLPIHLPQQETPKEPTEITHKQIEPPIEVVIDIPKESTVELKPKRLSESDEDIISKGFCHWKLCV